MAENQNAVPLVQHNYSSLSKFIYVLEKDTKNLICFNRQDNRVTKATLQYKVNNMSVALPHNYQCVQVGDEPKLYLIGGGDYQTTP